jgi:glycosyltransferase involved in cell wall biosynthesis
MQCGIATYSRFLIEELKELENTVYVVSEYGAEGENVHPVYNSQDPDLSHKIFQTMIKFGPDIVHIQHEFGLFGPHKGINVLPLIYMFKLSRIPVVTTLHTVYENFAYDSRIIIEAVVRASDAIIVHEDYQKESIFKNIARFDNIFVIPHGVRKVNFIRDAKHKIGVQGRKIILLLGYFRPSKNYEQIIRIMPQIKKQVPDALLIVAGNNRMKECSEYMDKIVEMIKSSAAADSIKYIKGEFSKDTLDTIICSADVAVLPYKISGQSGVMAHCLAFGIPLVTSEIRIFEETFKKAKCGLVSLTDEDYVENIVKILTDNNLKNKLSLEALKLVKEQFSWEIVGKKTIEVYQSIGDNCSSGIPPF